MNTTIKIEPTVNGYYVKVDNEFLIDPETYVFSSDLELMEFVAEYLNMESISVLERTEDRDE